jgi:hypothetical protein
MMYCAQCDNCTRETMCCNAPTIDVIKMLDCVSNHDLSQGITMVSDDGTIIPMLECNFFDTSKWTEDEIEEVTSAESDAVSLALDIQDRY